jgi:hypothetical protein
MATLNARSWPPPKQNRRFQELGYEVVMAERWQRQAFQYAPLLRWHIGWKKGNRLIESSSWNLSSLKSLTALISVPSAQKVAALQRSP